MKTQLFTQGNKNCAHFMEQNPESEERGTEGHGRDQGFEMKSSFNPMSEESISPK